MLKILLSQPFFRNLRKDGDIYLSQRQQIEIIPDPPEIRGILHPIQPRQLQIPPPNPAPPTTNPPPKRRNTPHPGFLGEEKKGGVGVVRGRGGGILGWGGVVW